MDTNVKKFKYSLANKIICILLCLVTFMLGSWYAILSVTAIAYRVETTYSNAQSTDNWTNTTGFYRLFLAYCNSAASTVTESEDIAHMESQYEQNKEQYIDEAYDLVLSLKNQAESNPKIDYEYNYDEYGNEIVESTTFMDYENYADSYDIIVDGYNVYTIELRSAMSKEDVENLFDDADGYIRSHIESHYYQMRYYTGIDNSSRYNEVKYYAKFGETVSTNAEDFNEKEAYACDYYFISKHGEFEYKGICDQVAEDVFGNLSANSNYFKDTDFYFYFNVEDLSAEDIIDLAFDSYGKEFSQLYTFTLACEKANDNLSRNITLALVSLVISFISGFIYFAVTGKKDEEDNAKLFIYDYLPFELSIATAGALAVGVLTLFANTVWDAYEISMITMYNLWALIMFCWILLFFVSASFARNIHSGKKFYKHLLTYWVLFAIWKICEFIFKGIKYCFNLICKLLRKIKASAKCSFNAFIFKPHHYKRNIIAIVFAWLFLNILLCGLIIWCLVNDGFFIGFIFAVGMAALDILTLRKFGEYVKNLDTIIDAASRHEEVFLDFDKLDNSLKTLAESMRYTNAELQNAITKAVKDERLRTELITNVSHDLKTPLTSIITYVDLLSKCDIQDEKAQEYIKVLDDKGAKLKRLIDDLIEASKVTSGNVTVNLAPMNLSELCLQATVDAQTDFEKAGLELVVKQGEKPSIVVADGTKANRVIENLLSNARKYSAKASRVYVSVYNEGNCGIFEIKNISAQPLDITPEELTERFVRGDKSRNQDGNGLGLSIAKELCRLQNGKLELTIDGDLFKARVMFPNK